MALAKNITDYVRSSFEELKKVAWPTRRETINQTVLVVSGSIAIAAFLGIVDYGFTVLLRVIVGVA